MDVGDDNEEDEERSRERLQERSQERLQERLDERIAELGDAVERCRKISLAAKLVAGAGAVCLMAVLLGLFTAEPPVTIAAGAAVLGGLVLLGSNASTWEQTEAALASAFAARDGAKTLVPEDELPVPATRPDLRIVDGGRPTLH
jgi:uncharacterized membrane protein